MEQKFKTAIVDGKEVIVKSIFKELDFQTVQDELNRVESQMSHLLYKVDMLRKEYKELQEEQEFYKETMGKFARPETETMEDDIFNIE